MEIEKVNKVFENARVYQNSKSEKVFVHEIKFNGSEKVFEYHSPKEICGYFKENCFAKFEIVESEEKNKSGVKKIYEAKPIFEISKNVFAETKEDNILDKKEKAKQRAIVIQSSISAAAQFYQQRQGNESDLFDLAEKLYFLATTKF